MRRALLLVLVVTSSCSAASHSSAEPPEPRSTEPRVPQAPSRDSEDAASTQRWQDWYCFELRRPGQTRYYSTCLRTQERCEEGRDDLGVHGETTPCRFQDRAYCYRVRDPVDEFEGRFCADSLTQCMRQRLSSSNDPHFDIIADCEMLD